VFLDDGKHHAFTTEPAGWLDRPAGSECPLLHDYASLQWTAGFHIESVPALLCFHTQTCWE
jgi:hypothetical protein